MASSRTRAIALIFACASVASPAAAADIAVKAPALVAPAPIWTGFYVGGAIGMRRADSDLTMRSADMVFTNSVQHDLPACLVEPLPCASGASFGANAFRVSAYSGYDWQLGSSWLVGVEGDWGWAKKSATATGFKFGQAPGMPGGSSFSIESDWDASARARIGYLFSPSLLAYATGGAAWLRTAITSYCGPIDCFPPAYGTGYLTQSKTWMGWTLGGGVEAMLGSGWVLRGEYRYSDYGSENVHEFRDCMSGCANLKGVAVSYDVAMKSQTVTVGLAYKFAPGTVLARD